MSSGKYNCASNGSSWDWCIVELDQYRSKLYFYDYIHPWNGIKAHRTWSQRLLQRQNELRRRNCCNLKSSGATLLTRSKQRNICLPNDSYFPNVPGSPRSATFSLPQRHGEDHQSCFSLIVEFYILGFTTFAISADICASRDVDFWREIWFWRWKTASKFWYISLGVRNSLLSPYNGKLAIRDVRWNALRRWAVQLSLFHIMDFHRQLCTT